MSFVARGGLVYTREWVRSRTRSVLSELLLTAELATTTTAKVPASLRLALGRPPLGSAVAAASVAL